MTARRVLVTGATGFVGRQALAPLLGRGFEVHGAAPDAPLREPAGVVWHGADLLEPGASERLCAAVRPTHLLHLAWYTAHGRFWAAPENFRWVASSLELLEAFVRHGGSRVVSAGSCAEYDWCVEGPLRERETPLSPATPYGACKATLGSLQASFARVHGLSAAWGRVFFPYGPHEHPDRFVAHVVRRLLEEAPAECTSGRQERDFLHVADVAAAFAALLDGGVEGPVNIASGRAVPLKEVAAEIARQLGRPDLLRLGALPDRPGDPPSVVASTERLSREVVWQPHHTLESGLAETVEWWRGRAGEDCG